MKKLFPDPEQPLINNLAGRLKISTSPACIGVYIVNVDYQLMNKFKNKTFYMIFLTIIHLCIILISFTLLQTFWIFFVSWVFMNDVSGIRLLFIRFIVTHFFQLSFQLITCIKFIIIFRFVIMNRWSFQNTISLWVWYFIINIVLYMFYWINSFQNIIASIINSTHYKVRYDNNRFSQ